MENKKLLWNIIIALPFAAAIITCIIINYALERQLNWALIVTGGCLLAYLPLALLLFSSKYRFVKMNVAFTILLIPYLFLIEIVCNSYTSKPSYWAASFGTPVALLWLGALWLLIFIRKITRANGWIIAGIAVLLFYFAERITNTKIDILEGTSNTWRLSEQYPVAYWGLAIVLIFIGLIAMLLKYAGKQKNIAKND